MVYRENPNLKWMLYRGTPILRTPQMNIGTACEPQGTEHRAGPSKMAAETGQEYIVVVLFMSISFCIYTVYIYIILHHSTDTNQRTIYKGFQKWRYPIMDGF